MQSDAQIEPPLDFVLTLERVVRFHGPRVRFDHFRTGILYEDVDIHLRRRGGRWLKPSVHGFSGRLSKRFVLHKINTDQLKWKQNSLSGKISMTSSRYLHRSDMTIGMVLHHTPPELKPVIGWHLGGQKRIRPQKQTFHITTDPNESGVLLRLSIRDALQGKQAGERKLGMELKLRRTGDTWTHLHAVTPKWNRAFHDVDASALKVTDERIAGTIAVILRPDRWVPAGLQSKRQHYTFAGRVTHGDFVADCQSEGDFGSYETSVTGRLLQTIQSQCTSKGIDAKRHGRSLVGFVSAEDALESLPPREEAGEIYADIRALHQALVEYPAGQTSQTRPKSPTVVNDQALKNLVRVSRAAMGGLEKEPTISMGVPPISDENFGPFEGDSSPLAGAPNVEEERSWEFLDKWQCSGPMPLVKDSALLPETVPGMGKWFSEKKDGLPPRPTVGRFIPQQIKEGVLEEQMRSFCWYGVSDFESPQEMPVWMAVPANSFGRLWLNGVLVWRGSRYADSLNTAVFLLKVLKGRNRILFRAGVSDLLHKSLTGSVRVNADRKMRLAEFGVFISVRRAGLSPSSEDKEQAKARTTNEEVTPPIAFNLRSGLNVAWQADCSVRGTGVSPAEGEQKDHGRDAHATRLTEPVLHGGKLFIAAEPDRLLCVDANSGTKLWEHRSTISDDQDTSGRSSSPVISDKKLWVWHATGAITCCDLDGNRVWFKQMDMQCKSANRRNPSLILNGNLLILHSPDEDVPEKLVVTAVDSESSDTVWSTKLTSRPGIVSMTLRHGDNQKHVIITPAGHVIDSGNGKILHEQIHGGYAVSALPSVSGDKVYFYCGRDDYITGGWWAGWKSSARLWLDDASRVGCRFLWRSKGPSHNGGLAPLAHNGLLYQFCVNQEHHMEFPNPRSNLHIYDADNGTQLADIKPLFEDAVSPGSITVAGKYIFCIEVGAREQFLKDPRPELAVLAIGDDPMSTMVIARNRIPSTSIKPVFDGSRMYLTAEGRIYCIAAATERGRKCQDEIIARSIFRNIIGWRQTATTPKYIEAEPMELRPPDRGIPTTVFRDRAMPNRWVMLGPLPKAIVDSPLDMLSGKFPQAGQSVTLGGKSYEFNAIGEDQMLPVKSNYYRIDNDWGYSVRLGFDLLHLTSRKQNTSTWFFTNIENRHADTRQYRARSLGLRTWFAGREIRPGDLIHMPEGYFPLILRSDIGRVPPFLRKDQRIILHASFHASPGPLEQRASRLARIRRYRSQLEHIIATMPGTKHKHRAKEMLEELKP